MRSRGGTQTVRGRSVEPLLAGSTPARPSIRRLRIAELDADARADPALGLLMFREADVCELTRLDAYRLLLHPPVTRWTRVKGWLAARHTNVVPMRAKGAA